MLVVCMINSIIPFLAAEGERKGTEHLDLAGVQTKKQKALDTHSPEGKKKSKGIMKLFGRSLCCLLKNIIHPKMKSFTHPSPLTKPV